MEDPRDAALARVDAVCRALTDLVWQLESATDELRSVLADLRWPQDEPEEALPARAGRAAAAPAPVVLSAVSSNGGADEQESEAVAVAEPEPEPLPEPDAEPEPEVLAAPAPSGRRSGLERRLGGERRTTKAEGVVARVFSASERRSGNDRRSGTERRQAAPEATAANH